MREPLALRQFDKKSPKSANFANQPRNKKGGRGRKNKREGLLTPLSEVEKEEEEEEGIATAVTSSSPPPLFLNQPSLLPAYLPLSLRRIAQIKAHLPPPGPAEAEAEADTERLSSFHGRKREREKGGSRDKRKGGGGRERERERERERKPKVLP